MTDAIDEVVLGTFQILVDKNVVGSIRATNIYFEMSLDEHCREMRARFQTTCFRKHMFLARITLDMCSVNGVANMRPNESHGRNKKFNKKISIRLLVFTNTQPNNFSTIESMYM